MGRGAKRGGAGDGGSWGVGILDRLTFDPTTAARGIDPRTPPVHRDASSQKSPTTVLCSRISLLIPFYSYPERTHWVRFPTMYTKPHSYYFRYQVYLSRKI